MNKLQKSTFKKIFREHFQGEVPIVKYGSEQKMLISEIKQKLTTMNSYALLDSYYPRYIKKESDELCSFEVQSRSTHYDSPEFTVKFNDQNELIIEQRYGLSSPVYRLEQIYTLFDKLTSEFKRLDANSSKRQSKSQSKSQSKRQSDQIKKKKIKELKHNAIIAKIHQIAKEEQLEFYLIEYVTKVKLAIRLAESEMVEIDIPYSKFQQILTNLPAMIQAIKEFHELGITFKMRRTGYRHPKWISYQDEQKFR